MGIYLNHHASRRFMRNRDANMRAKKAFQGLVERSTPWGSNERSRHDRPVAWKLVITLFYTLLLYRAVQYHAYACVAAAAVGGTIVLDAGLDHCAGAPASGDGQEKGLRTRRVPDLFM